MHKSDVIRLGVELGVPLELTLSCMNPRQGLHCGQCSKCRERRDAFHEAGIDDRPPTRRSTARGRATVRHALAEVAASLLAGDVIAPSPLRSRSVRPPLPRRPRSDPRSSSFWLVRDAAEAVGVHAAVAGVRVELGVEVRAAAAA